MSKGFGRRQTYESLTCRNPRWAVCALWGFRILAVPVLCSDGYRRCRPCRVMARVPGWVAVDGGGARGCCQRSKVSMTTICPPQHGHGGRWSTGSSALSSWLVRGATVEQLAGERQAGLAGGAGEQAIVADAMEAARQDVEQEAADKLVGCERHDLLPVGPVAAIVLVAEGDASARRTRSAGRFEIATRCV
jgi:hypothetical protein